MNAIFWIILAALTLEFAVGLLATILNVRALRLSLPLGLEDVYGSQEYTRSQRYARVQARFGLTVGFCKLALLLVVWFVGGFNYIDQIIRLMEWNAIWSGVVFIGILSAFSMLVDIPFNLYATFVIEARFGFNRTTYSTYLKDTLKNVILSTIIGGPVLIGVLYFFGYAGAYSWIYVWVFLTGISLVTLVIGPMWIMPLFNKFTPLEPGELRDAIVAYARTVDFTYANIYVIDGSKRSAHSNAFFTGFGKTKRIALFDTLIEQLSTDEIVAVIAHEVGHNRKRHIVSNMALSILHMGVLLFLLSLMMENQYLFGAFFMDQTSIYASLWFFGLVFTPIELIISPAMLLISRRNEYQADRWAVETTRDRQNLMAGLKKLASNNLANLSPHPLFVVLHYSHPPLLNRIQEIDAVQL